MREPTHVIWDDRLDDAAKEDLARINGSLDRLSALRSTQVKQSGVLRSRVAWRLAAYREVLLFRTVALTNSIAAAWNSRNTLAAFLSARALMETIAVLVEYEARVAVLLAKKDIAGLEALAEAGFFASRESCGA
jgi:hypothetical protein